MYKIVNSIGNYEGPYIAGMVECVRTRLACHTIRPIASVERKLRGRIGIDPSRNNYSGHWDWDSGPQHFWIQVVETSASSLDLPRLASGVLLDVPVHNPHEP